MPSSELNVRLLTHTLDSKNVIATAAKLCYSGSNIGQLQNKISENDQSEFLKKLIDMNHYSPIEHASFTFAIEGVSRALLAQITRHRIASFSVKSQRYVDYSKNGEFEYIVPPSISKLGDEAVEEYKNQMKQINKWYKQWNEVLGEDKKEDARFVLPNAAETKMLMTVNVRELMHIFNLRCCNRAQWEVRAMCWNMLGLCLSVEPELFSNSGPICCFKPCDQGAFSCKKAKEVALDLCKLKAFVSANSVMENFSDLLGEWIKENIL